jgi:chondroitin 4-sulfotransferase 11
MQDAIFIRIPKTAGRSIQEALKDAFAKDPAATLHSSSLHPDARTLMLEVDWNAFYKFSFIRNPWDRVVSAYFFKFTDKFKHALDVFYQLGQVDQEMLALYRQFWRDRPNFDDWILNGFERYFLTAKNQLDYLVDTEGRIAVDFIGRFESLEGDFARVCRDLGCPGCRLQYHINRTEHAPYATHYTDRSIEKVAAVYARDIAMFGYTFGA